MAEEFYQLPESPVYNAETIRKIQDTDPVRASTIVNPVISRLIENTHAVKKLADKAQQEAASAAAAEEYSSESVYNAGSYCTRGGKLYKANQDILSAEPCTEAHWTETNIAAELVAIYTALSNKAPSGYGLGTFGPVISDLNTATKSGFYTIAGTYQNGPADIGAGFSPLLVLSGSEGNRIAQVYYGINASYHGCIATRYYSNGPQAWSPWEWINPPMQIGVEYRTAERHNGKPVYMQLVSCGALEAETMKTVILPVSVDWIVSCVGMHGPNVNGHRQASPFYYNNGSTELVFHCAAEAYHIETEDKIYLYLYATQATTESHALLKYMKETA